MYANYACHPSGFDKLVGQIRKTVVLIRCAAIKYTSRSLWLLHFFLDWTCHPFIWPFHQTVQIYFFRFASCFFIRFLCGNTLARDNNSRVQLLVALLSLTQAIILSWVDKMCNACSPSTTADFHNCVSSFVDDVAAGMQSNRLQFNSWEDGGAVVLV